MKALTTFVSKSVDVARESFDRFSAPLIGAFITTGIFLYLSRDFVDFDDSDPLLKVATVGVYFTLMATVVTLLVEAF